MSMFAGQSVSCNARSYVQKHNFGRDCRCMKHGRLGGGGLPIMHDVIGFVHVKKVGNVTESQMKVYKLIHDGPHLCGVCGREFIE